MLARYKYLMAVFLALSINSSYVRADEEKKAKVKNPFEMVIFNLGRNKFSEPKTTRDSVVSMQRTYSANKNNIDELSVEVPFYKDYVALGFQFDMMHSKRIVGTAYMALVKFRLPLQFKLGHIALTNTYRAGVTSLLFHTVNGDFEMHKFGVTAIPSIGIDYFPIRWFGVYCEYSWRYANIFRNKQQNKTINKPYSYTTDGFSLGFKFTF
jgi:hypothetical protein